MTQSAFALKNPLLLPLVDLNEIPLTEKEKKHFNVKELTDEIEKVTKLSLISQTYISALEKLLKAYSSQSIFAHMAEMDTLKDDAKRACAALGFDLSILGLFVYSYSGIHLAMNDGFPEYSRFAYLRMVGSIGVANEVLDDIYTNSSKFVDVKNLHEVKVENTLALFESLME